MRLFIPDIGTTMTLAQDWTFALHYENRNADLFAGVRNESVQHTRNALWYDKWNYMAGRASSLKSEPFTLPAGTVLRVERVYIRRGGQAYSSVTFRAAAALFGRPIKSYRFWAKLADVNTMEIEG